MINENMLKAVKKEYELRQIKEDDEAYIAEEYGDILFAEKKNGITSTYDLNGMEIEHEHNFSNEDYLIILNSGKPSDLLSFNKTDLHSYPYFERKASLKTLNCEIGEYLVSSIENITAYSKTLLESNKNVSIMSAKSKYMEGENRDYVVIMAEDKPKYEYTPQNNKVDIKKELNSIKDEWVPYVIQHHYKGKSIHTDIRIKIEEGLIGFTLFTPGNATNLDKLSNESSMIMQGEWKKHKAEDIWLKKNEYIEGTNEVILCVDSGKIRVHSIEQDKIVLQFNGSRKDVDDMPLMKAGFKNASPTKYKNLEGYWVFFKEDEQTMVRKVKKPEANKMALEWIERLCKTTIIPNNKIKDIYEHFSNENITYVSRLSKELSLDAKTIYKFRDKLGFK